MKPILFNTEMVQAILDGRKTVTRRVVKHQPPPTTRVFSGCNVFAWAFWEDSEKHHLIPPYDPGDILYVRETCCGWYLPHGEWRYCYKATEPDGNRAPTGPEYDDEWVTRPWCPSIHMPKKAARIFLRVKAVRAERLQDISIQQVEKEGIDNLFPDLEAEELCNYCPLDECERGVHCYGGDPIMCEGRFCPDAYKAWCQEFTDEFYDLWDSTIKPIDRDKYGWEANPWVWVIEFERCEKPKEGKP